jgi:hypothetical protein
MENNLITEISKIHKMMGVSLINEGNNPLSSLLKLVINTLDETIQSNIKNLMSGTLDSTGKQELITLFKSDEGETIITNLKNQIKISSDRVATALAKKELQMIKDLVELGVKKTSLEVNNAIKSIKAKIGSDAKFALIFSQATDSAQAKKIVGDFLENGIKSGKSYEAMADDAFKLAMNQPGVKQAQRDAMNTTWGTWKKRVVNNKYLLMIGGTILLLWGNGVIKNFSYVTNLFKKLGEQVGFGTTPDNGGGSTSNNLIPDAEKWLKKNRYWSEGMTLTSTNDPNEVIWKLNGQQNSIYRQDDGSFK